MGRFQQRYRGYGYGLVERLGHMQFNRLMFVLEHIWRLMAIPSMRKQLEFCLMDQFQQRYRGYGYGLVVQLGHMRFDQ